MFHTAELLFLPKTKLLLFLQILLYFLKNINTPGGLYMVWWNGCSLGSSVWVRVARYWFWWSSTKYYYY